MGILNLTPDSFYEPSRVSGKDAAVDRGLRMVDEGADVLDLGGESTRPGSEPVDPEEQCRRLLPVLEQLRQKWDGAISVDTTSAQVAQRAFEAGADIINDFGAARLDSEMPRMLSESGLPVVLMHMQGTPETMQIDPRYDDVVKEVGDFLVRRAGDLEEVWQAPRAQPAAHVPARHLLRSRLSGRARGLSQIVSWKGAEG